MRCAAAICIPPKSAFEEVSDPVRATPNQPRNPESRANTLPSPASQVPSEMAIPERFMT